MRKLFLAFPLLLPLITPQPIQSQTVSGVPSDTIQPFMTEKPPQFPDMGANYIKTIVEPQQAAQRALDEQARIQAEQQAQTVYIAPTQPTGSCQSWMSQAGITDPQSAYTLIMRESGCRVDAYNPSGAYGIPQSLPGNKMASMGTDWQTNPITQLKWMQSYVFSTYGTWANALQHSYQFNWY